MEPTRTHQKTNTKGRQNKFKSSVFVNCPFDDDYLPLLRPLLFTITYLGFQPRIALERLDSGEPRIKKITSLIADSRDAIHDLSRLKAKKAGELYRLNMPFELGVDVGCRLFSKGPHETKRCLILEAERYRYQAAISDLSNSDIEVHNNEPETVARVVRNWLNSQAALNALGPSAVWGAFLDFAADNDTDLKQRGYTAKDIRDLPINELTACMQEWTAKRTNR